MSRRRDALQGGESGAAIAPGNAPESLLWQKVSEDEMPPKHPLSAKQKETLRMWIAEGANWGDDPIDPFAYTTSNRAGYDWWALQPLAPNPLPPRDAFWGRNEIDRFVLAKLKESGLAPSPEAEPRVLIRRLAFDLTGIPPDPAWVAEFVDKPSESNYQRIVGLMLASPAYGERWGRHWLDVVRFGESDGFERNNPRKNAWHYRDWVIRSLNNDLPYDQFVRMQLIGDQLKPGVEGAAATGFWVAGVHNTVVGGSERMKKLARQDEIEEVLATVGQTFLGLTVNCSRCHDHKFDPITQREYYRLASAISGLGYGERNVESQVDSKRIEALSARLAQVDERLSEIEDHVREEIRRDRERGDLPAPQAPKPFARWEFDSDFRDALGQLHGKPVGEARIKDGALLLSGREYVYTAPLNRPMRAKTLAAWVQLKSLKQRGGAAISIESTDGVRFDAIVFGEREPMKWMAGSNLFARTAPFQGPAESEATGGPVHIALAYREDGTIVAYRDGLAYGKPIRKGGLQPFEAMKTEILFGLRHKPGAPGRYLTGRIHQASLYDRALSAAEVAAAAGNLSAYVPESLLLARLSPQEKRERRSLHDESKEIQAELTALKATANRKMFTLTPGGGARTHVLLRGDPLNEGDLVSPGGVKSLRGVDADFALPPDAPEKVRRAKLADWITAGDNPLFPRVLANRVWHYHFGQGIVDTPNDFGFNGGRPSHPQLLEWLAAAFRENGMRLKPLHRLIVSSSTYRQASRHRQEAASIDAGNRLLWRVSPRRLEAEAVRDSILVAAGKLNRQIGGPSFEDVKIISNNGTMYYEPFDADGDAYFRRTVYRFNPRGGRSALLDTFDCPDPAAAAPRRAVTTTPLQALSLLNNGFVLRMSDYFAERVKKDAGEKLADQVELAWRIVLHREPSSSEFTQSIKLVRQHGLGALARGLFNATEFVIVQ